MQRDYPRPIQTAADMVKRLVPARAWPPLVGVLRSWRYTGTGVTCPCCDHEFRAFRHHRDVPGIRCPWCGSLGRQRMLRLYFDAHPDLLAAGTSFLHFAPEYCLMKAFERAPGVEYRTADIDSPLADDEVDLMRTPYADASFDLILCSHVLEHVEDDRRALAEIHRILNPGGRALLLVPIDPKLGHTIEDPSVTDPVERLERFGQEDHCRAYGRDLVERFGAAGFDVEPDRYGAGLPADSVERMKLPVDEEIYVCRKRGT